MQENRTEDAEARARVGRVGVIEAVELRRT
jgi:hypothetical protein